MIPIVVLISGNGTNLQAIINKCHGQTVDIKAVISDQFNAYGLKRAAASEIPTKVCPQRCITRDEYCLMLSDVVADYEPELIVLAGFMKILTPQFVNRFQNKIINIHPSLLPKYKGLNTHQRMKEAGDRTHGITIHVVNEELDSGPIILQKSISVFPVDDVEMIETRIHQLEHIWYPEVINTLARWQTAIRKS